jgi:hypothetical protein
VLVPIPAVEGVNKPVEETPLPDHVPPKFADISCIELPVTHCAPTGVIVELGGPVCAPGGGPNCMVKLDDDPPQFSTTIITVCPAVT